MKLPSSIITVVSRRSRNQDSEEYNFWFSVFRNYSGCIAEYRGLLDTDLRVQGGPIHTYLRTLIVDETKRRHFAQHALCQTLPRKPSPYEDAATWGIKIENKTTV